MRSDIFLERMAQGDTVDAIDVHGVMLVKDKGVDLLAERFAGRHDRVGENPLTTAVERDGMPGSDDQSSLQAAHHGAERGIGGPDDASHCGLALWSGEQVAAANAVDSFGPTVGEQDVAMACKAASGLVVEDLHGCDLATGGRQLEEDVVGFFLQQGEELSLAVGLHARILEVVALLSQVGKDERREVVLAPAQVPIFARERLRDLARQVLEIAAKQRRVRGKSVRDVGNELGDQRTRFGQTGGIDDAFVVGIAGDRVE